MGPGTHSTGGWVGPSASMDRYGEIQSVAIPGVEPRTIQPMASHYIDYAIPASITYIVTLCLFYVLKFYCSEFFLYIHLDTRKI